MMCCEGHHLLPPTGEERIGADDQRIGWRLDQGGESGLNLAFAAGLEDFKVHACDAGRFLSSSTDWLGIWIVRVHK